jgi:hypothetical protein
VHYDDLAHRYPARGRGPEASVCQVNEKDPITRLATVKRRMDRAKASKEATFQVSSMPSCS